jgi:LPPG:FO 2-phospho-L-lactate transferase
MAGSDAGRARAAPSAPQASEVHGIVALAGGVGAARFLSGLVRVVPPARVTAIVNTGDDHRFYGVHVSPDVDIVTYTLAGVVDRERGYGLAGDTTAVIETLASLGHESWFRLGDRDFAHCHHRTLALASGRGLADITDELRRAHGVAARILPMSEDPCPTYVELSGGRRVHFEEYLARDGAPDDVAAVDLAAARRAAPAPGVLDAIAGADAILVCPSNPVVSIGPILAVPGIAGAIRRARAPAVAISPIVGGAPVKGPADRLLRGLGVEVSPTGVAKLYRDVVRGFVLDARDAVHAPRIEAEGLRTRVTDTLMRDPEIAAALARTALELARELA